MTEILAIHICDIAQDFGIAGPLLLAPLLKNASHETYHLGGDITDYVTPLDWTISKERATAARDILAIKGITIRLYASVDYGKKWSLLK